MSEEGSYSPRLYWRYLWRNRPKAKVFSFYRAVPSLLIASIQFLWFHGKRPMKELWIIGGTICGVYLVLLTLENLWNFIVLAPVRIYAEQIALIGDLTAKNSFLESQLRVPKLSPQEQRRRDLVSHQVKNLTEVERKLLRHLCDDGRTHSFTLFQNHNELVVNNFIAKTVPTGLVLYDAHFLSVKPELASAIEFVLSQEHDKDDLRT
jgi:hypothetical protein